MRTSGGFWTLSLCEKEIMFPAQYLQSYWGKSYGNELWLSTSFMNCKLPYTFEAFIHLFTHSPMELCLALGIWSGDWYGKWDRGSSVSPWLKGMDFEVRLTWNDSGLTTLWPWTIISHLRLSFGQSLHHLTSISLTLIW